jgi:hypothetical protein
MDRDKLASDIIFGNFPSMLIIDLWDDGDLEPDPAKMAPEPQKRVASRRGAGTITPSSSAMARPRKRRSIT